MNSNNPARNEANFILIPNLFSEKKNFLKKLEKYFFFGKKGNFFFHGQNVQYSDALTSVIFDRFGSSGSQMKWKPYSWIWSSRWNWPSSTFVTDSGGLQRAKNGCFWVFLKSRIFEKIFHFSTVKLLNKRFWDANDDFSGKKLPKKLKIEGKKWNLKNSIFRVFWSWYDSHIYRLIGLLFATVRDCYFWVQVQCRVCFNYIFYIKLVKKKRIKKYLCATSIPLQT